MLNGIVLQTVGQQLVEDVVAHCEDVWSQYQIPPGQVDAFLAYLMLLHQHMKCTVDPQFYRDEDEEEVRL